MKHRLIILKSQLLKTDLIKETELNNTTFPRLAVCLNSIHSAQSMASNIIFKGIIQSSSL